MSELELKNIVGFKAVDAEGNEQQVTVDEMAELVSARIVSAASEISTFAATAAAGTDEFEDQLPVSDTFSWLRTMDGSNNPTLTSSTAAAKVLGGLIGINESWFRSRGDISGVNDLTEIKNSGIYKLNDVTFNLSYKYGSLIVLNSGIQVIQFSLAFHSNVLHIRTNWNNEKWTNWQTVSLT